MAVTNMTSGLILNVLGKYEMKKTNIRFIIQCLVGTGQTEVSQWSNKTSDILLLKIVSQMGPPQTCPTFDSRENIQIKRNLEVSLSTPSETTT